jgi:hypothetical protein
MEGARPNLGRKRTSTPSDVVTEARCATNLTSSAGDSASSITAGIGEDPSAPVVASISCGMTSGSDTDSENETILMHINWYTHKLVKNCAVRFSVPPNRHQLAYTSAGEGIREPLAEFASLAKQCKS